MRPPHAPVAAALPPFPLPLLLLALLLLLSCVPGVVPLVNAQRGPAPGQCLDSVKLKAPLPVPARTKKATDLIVFGDSLSDTGNAFTATGFPAPPFYCSGRRSDGPLWVDGVRDAAGKLLRVQNLAYVGAVLCEQFAAPAFKADNAAAGLLSLEQQVLTYLASLKDGPPVLNPGNRAALIWLGANDVGNSLRGDPTQLPDVIQATAECLVRNVTTLAATRSFAVVYIAMLPPLERYPTVIAEATPTQLLQVAGVVNGANAAYGAALTQLGAALAAKLGSAAPKLRVIDTTTAIRAALDAPPAGITDTTSPCLAINGDVVTPDPDVTSRCDDASARAFYDGLHYTSAFHLEVIAPLILSQLRADDLAK